MRPWLAYALLACGAAAISGFTILTGVNPHDEGLMLQAASRVLDGQLPYHDFWWNYGPGQPLLLAAPAKLLGDSLLWWRILRLAMAALVAVMTYRFVRRDGTPATALVAWAACAGALAFPALPSPTVTVLGLALGSFLLADRRPAVAGALAGLAVAVRIDMGLAVVAGVLIAAHAGRAGTRRTARAAAGAAAAAVAALAPFVIAGGPRRFWDQTVGFAFDQQSLQRLPLPLDPPSADPNKLLEFWFPPILLAGLAVWAVAALWRRPPLRTLAPLPLALVGAAYLLARTDEFHLIPLAAVLPLLLGTVVAGSGSVPRAVTALAWIASALIVVHGLDRQAGRLLHPGERAAIPLAPADGVRARGAEARALGRLGRAVHARVPPGAPIFVANPRFDLVRVGNPLLYVLLDRPNPTRYDVMQPGIVTTRRVQREMAADLARARPGVVVRWLDPTADRAEPNGAGRPSGVRTLDRWIDRHYRERWRFGTYAILEPRRP